MVPAIVVFLLNDDFVISLILFTLSGVSDSLDGFLARVLHQQTTLGACLDPIADKALIVSSYVILAMKGAIPLWLTGIVIGRDCIIILGSGILFFLSLMPEVRPSVTSKITTALQVVTVFLVLLFFAFPHAFSFSTRAALTMSLSILYGLTALFTVCSGIQYLVMGIGILQRRGAKHILP